MTIDTKRLATDAAYWDEVARDFGCVSPGTPPTICGIPRPTKPAAPEWDGYVDADDESEWLDGVPPTGCECEYRPDPNNSFWDECAYLAHFGGEHFVLVLETGNVDRMPDRTPAKERFRPLRTKEQRQRDELLNVMGQASTPLSIGRIADAILSRYNLEPKP